jgi:periplasmic protein TonB
MMDQISDSSPLVERPPYRPPIGIPLRGEPRAQATVAAVLVHVLIILLILTPTLFLSTELVLQSRGAGGKGPVGGGGGGIAGTGASGVHFTPEQVRYLRLTTPQNALKVPVQTPPKPEEKKPPPVEPKPDPQLTTESKPATSADSGATTGGNGGTGKDGTSGNGPGSGGGVGSGVGPGRGSGNGPGTGGGDDMVYPPAVVALPILPLPVPSKVRPYRMTAQFDVDSLGNARLLTFNPSKDAGYNKRIREMLMEIRFRPAVRPDGRPVRALAVVTAEAL